MALKLTLTLFDHERGARYRALGYGAGVIFIYYHDGRSDLFNAIGDPPYWMVSTVAAEDAPPWMRRIIENHPVKLVYAGAGEKVVDADLISPMLLS